MSRENVEAVRRVIGRGRSDSAEPGQLEEFVSRLAPEIEFHEDPRFPEARVYRGREEVLRYFREVNAPFERLLWTVEELIDAGDAGVLVCSRLRGFGGSSGAEFNARPGWLYTVEGGRVVRIRAFLDRDEALEALGLSG